MSARDAQIRAALAGVTRALEALDSGEDDGFIGDLLEGVERDLSDVLAPAQPRPLRCRVCGLVVRWRGELDDHHRFVHGASA